MKKLAALLVSACLLLSGCGDAAQNGGDTGSENEGVATGHVVEEKTAEDSVFSVNYDAEAGLNPIRSSSSTNSLFWSLVYDTVFNVDEDFAVTPNLVTDYSTTDNQWWVFYIDTSIPFSDGSTLTAKDIVYSIRQAQQSAYYSSRLSIIYGISAMGEDCFAISTKYPDSFLPSLLNIPVIKDGTIGESSPPGSGPYRLSDEGDSLVLFEENRHCQEMPIDVIYLKSYNDIAEQISAFEASLIDVVTNDPTGMYNLGYGSSNEIRNFSTTNMHYLGFNMDSMYFQNSICRYAMMYAVDRDWVVDDQMAGCGEVAKLPLLPSSELYDAAYAEKFNYDLRHCFELFESANVADHDHDGALEILVTGIVVEINIDFIVNNDSSVKVQAARKLAEDLTSIGITTTLRELSWKDYVEALEEGEYDMYYGEIRLTPDWNLAYLFEEENEMNYAQCRDGSYTQLYYDYLAADTAGRYNAYQEACRYVMENGAIVPICFEKRQMLTHRGIVTDASPTQYDLFNKFSEWTINLK
ncbi:MAG: ABC transporter substrate-binding protein [Butyricicoccus sp.]|nr:ABC transporter substrate-binding protein [Butyricicoccus sp.]